MKLISVVMPVFNAAEVLRDQLVSLADQDFDDRWELIAADNGSSDASREVLEEFTQMLPIRIVDASARPGDAAARNIGVAGSGGDLILFCDADDVLDPQWIASHVACLGEADLSIGPYEMRTNMSESDSGSYVAVPMCGVYGFLPYGLSANMGIRRRAFDALGGFDEMYSVASDIDICWRAQVSGLTLGIAEDAVVVKRRRDSVGGMWHQHFAFGRADVRLYSNFRQQGISRSLLLALKTYGWLLVHSPDLFHRVRRLRWLGVVAQRSGRIVGSMQARQFFP